MAGSVARHFEHAGISGGHNYPLGVRLVSACSLLKGRDMRGQGAHMWMCVAMVVGALAVVLITGNALAFLPIIGCVVMMVVMMQMMGGMGGHDHHDRS